MNPKIEQIEAAERQSNTLVSEERKMRRDFMSDGTIDRDEQAQLDRIAGKIDQLKQVIADLRAEIERNRNIWEGRARDYSQLRSRLDDLRAFGHPDAGGVEDEVAAIGECVDDQRWADATTALDQAETTMGPVYDDYLLQSQAKADYETLRADFDTRMQTANGAPPISDQICNDLAGIEAGLPPIQTDVDAVNYVSALELLRELVLRLEQVEIDLETLRLQAEQYDGEWAAIQPRLHQTATCEYPDLVPMQEDIIALSEQIPTVAAEGDYARALEMIADLSGKIDTFLTAFEESATEQEIYDSRLPGVEADLAQCQTTEFPALAQQQSDINASADRMHAAATNHDYETALSEMDGLVQMIDAYLVELEQARLGREFEELLARLEPQFADAAVCTYPVLDDMSIAITDLKAQAESAAAAGDYIQAIALLQTAEGQIAALMGLIAAQDAAREEYERRSPDVLARCDGVSQCEYPQLLPDHQALIDLRTQIEDAVTQGDYIQALTMLDQLAVALDGIEATRDSLDAARAEFETRMPPLIARFDGLMQCDFAELEPVRGELTTLRANMEQAATALDFPTALDHLNAIERKLNDLEARMGDLEALRVQYEALYDSIKGQIEDVESCDHEELAGKKAEILALRDEMLAAAEATDYQTAVQKATALIAPLAEFQVLGALLKEYKRRLALVEPRVETARGFTFKSLIDDKQEIEDLYTAMQADAAAARLREAMTKMEQLEGKLTAIVALNEQLTLQKAVYEKLAADMADKIAVVRANTIEEAQSAADAVIQGHDAMTALGDADEYIDAVAKADEVNALIDKYLEKVDQFGDAREAYEIVRDLAIAAYDNAKEKAEEFEELSKAAGELDDLKSAMETAAGTENYAEAKSKAEELMRRAQNIEDRHSELLVAKEKKIAEARAALRRWEALPSDAEGRAEDEYKAAEGAKEALEGVLNGDDLDAITDKLSAFNEKMRLLEDALKTEGELKAEYEGKLESLQPRVTAAEGSPNTSEEELVPLLNAVTAAFKTMKDIVEDDNDYRRAIQKAAEVEGALAAFDKAEEALQGDKIRFDERMSGLLSVYTRAVAVTEPEDLAVRAEALRGLYEDAKSLGVAGDYDAALEKAAEVKAEAEAILARQEELEDAEAERTEQELEDEKARGDKCEDEDEDESIGDQVGDFVDDVVEEGENFVRDPTGTVSKWIESKDRGPIGEIIENTAQEILEHIPNPPISEVIDEVKDIYDKVSEVVDAMDDD
ncbi:hypothetical protein [Actibacterium ureilyticum]|uniref:hypothetical protein n=1 Tax=Actibacterium ureilyticum TaxID=1590614 RepID=UPI000BAAF237|nr:hypothetical protein [Actibacterium ureilyticum]